MTQGLLNKSITAEPDFYEHILTALQSTKDAVETVRAAHNLGALGTNFDDYHATAIRGDGLETQTIRPDLALFEDEEPTRRSWETLMMPIEVKAKHTYLKKSDPQPMTPPSQQASAHPLAESRRLAQEMAMQLGRDPSGFLSDYDLATTHNGMESEFFGQNRAKDTSCVPQTLHAEDIPSATKQPRRDSDSTSSSPNTGTGFKQAQSEGLSLSSPKRSSNETTKQIGFRVGTPILMSLRVIEIRIGERYEPHFTDDLESFFWLILWYVVQHVDLDPSGNGQHNALGEQALKTLNQLDRADSDFNGLWGTKFIMLKCCHRGTMKEDLENCRNTWAHDAALVGIIEELGAYFFRLNNENFPFPQYPPEIVFPKIVRILSEALQTMRLSSQSPSTGGEDS